MRARDYVVAAAATAALTAGSIAAIAQTGTPGHHGSIGPSGVVGACRVPASLPGQRVTVMLADSAGRGPMMGGFGYVGSMMGGRTMMLRALPQVVRAGTVTLVAVNHGARTHELVVLPLSRGAAVGTRAVRPDNTVSERGSLGESSRTCGRGSGDGIRAGSAGWVTVTLAAGRYELVCNRPGHYVAGMFTELDVR